MFGRFSRLGALLGLSWLTFLAQAAGAPKTPSARSLSSAPLGGINIGSPRSDTTLAETQQAIAAAQALHTQLVRIEVSWSALEPLASGHNDPRSLASTDRLIEAAASAGIRVIMVVDSTPCWASSAPRPLLQKCDPRRPSKANSWPPTNPGDFASLAASLATRYGTRLAAIEIWNEPDLIGQDYFAGPHKAERYAALVRAAYPAIKRANPQVLVLAGSLVGSNGAFLRALYAAGIKGFYDGLAVHFYTLTLGSLRSIHRVQVANGDPAPLWLDEFGWSSCWPRSRIQDEQACVTARTQAANLADVVHSLASTPYVRAVVPFKLKDSPREDFGVLTARGARKPAFAALAKAFASPFARPRSVTLSLHRRSGRVVASGSGPAGDYFQLEVLSAGALRYRVLFTLNRFNRYSIALPRRFAGHGLRVRVFQYWAGPGKAAQSTT